MSTEQLNTPPQDQSEVPPVPDPDIPPFNPDQPAQTPSPERTPNVLEVIKLLESHGYIVADPYTPGSLESAKTKIEWADGFVKAGYTIGGEPLHPNNPTVPSPYTESNFKSPTETPLSDQEILDIEHSVAQEALEEKRSAAKAKRQEQVQKAKDKVLQAGQAVAEGAKRAVEAVQPALKPALAGAEAGAMAFGAGVPTATVPFENAITSAYVEQAPEPAAPEIKTEERTVSLDLDGFIDLGNNKVNETESVTDVDLLASIIKETVDNPDTLTPREGNYLTELKNQLKEGERITAARIVSIQIVGHASDEWSGDASIGTENPGNARLSEQRAATVGSALAAELEKLGVDAPDIQTSATEHIIDSKTKSLMTVLAKSAGYPDLYSAIRGAEAGNPIPAALGNMLTDYFSSQRGTVASVKWELTATAPAEEQAATPEQRAFVRYTFFTEQAAPLDGLATTTNPITPREAAKITPPTPTPQHHVAQIKNPFHTTTGSFHK